LYIRTPFLMKRSLFLFRRGPGIPIFCAVLFLAWSMCGDQVIRVFRLTPI
jgi:hypothetical protein